MNAKKLIFSAIFILLTACPAVFAQQAATPLADASARADLPQDPRERYRLLYDKIMAYEGLNRENAQADLQLFFLKLQSAIDKGDFYRHLKTNPINRKFKPVCLVSVYDLNKKGATIKTDGSRHPREFKVEEALAKDLADMFRDSQKAGLKLKICSAYRSYEYQIMLIREFAAAGLSGYVASPSKSEHCLGLACDIEGPAKPYINTKEARWTMQNSEKYGFAMTMPPGGVPFEPWHYRYIGHDGVNLKNAYFNGKVVEMLKFLTIYRNDIIELIHAKNMMEDQRRRVEIRTLLIKSLLDSAEQSKERILRTMIKPLPQLTPQDLTKTKVKKGRARL